MHSGSVAACLSMLVPGSIHSLTAHRVAHAQGMQPLLQSLRPSVPAQTRQRTQMTLCVTTYHLRAYVSSTPMTLCQRFAYFPVLLHTSPPLQVCILSRPSVPDN